MRQAIRSLADVLEHGTSDECVLYGDVVAELLAGRLDGELPHLRNRAATTRLDLDAIVDRSPALRVERSRRSARRGRAPLRCRFSRRDSSTVAA